MCHESKLKLYVSHVVHALLVKLLGSTQKRTLPLYIKSGSYKNAIYIWPGFNYANTVQTNTNTGRQSVVDGTLRLVLSAVNLPADERCVSNVNPSATTHRHMHMVTPPIVYAYRAECPHAQTPSPVLQSVHRRHC